MFASEKRKRRVLLSVVALGVAATGGAAIWLTAAGANPDSEPAAFAAKGKFTSERTSTLNAESTQSSIQGTDFKGGYGRSKGKRVKIGDGEEVATLLGTLTPVAVESNDGRFIVYSSGHLVNGPANQGIKSGQVVGIPKVRIYDDLEGKDRLIEAGAYSPALSRDGQLAFVRGDSTQLRAGIDYTGKIVVGRVDGKSFETWTSDSATYFPYAWAGSTLLAYKAFPNSEAADLYAFTGPGQSRLLAPEAQVIAISPDASRVLVTANRRTVEIIRIADGDIEASLLLDGDYGADVDSSTTPHALGYSGSWYGDRVAAASDMGLAILNVKEGISIESLISPRDFASNIYDPTLLDETHLIGWVNLGHGFTEPESKDPPAPEEYDNALVECDLSAMRCDIGAPTDMNAWQRWVTNPSR